MHPASRPVFVSKPGQPYGSPQLHACPWHAGHLQNVTVNPGCNHWHIHTMQTCRVQRIGNWIVQCRKGLPSKRTLPTSMPVDQMLHN